MAAGADDIASSVARAGAKSEGGDFARLAEPFRRELLVHCYRMLGSVDEAEDVLQEIYLRAWRSYGGFEGRSSLRVWLYRIATNACLTALQHRTGRALPSGLAGPSDDPDADAEMAGRDVQWLEPIPDALVMPESHDPAVVAGARAGLRLALIASFQHLPARQRAVLILRDALDMPASEVARMLDTSTAAVKSTLQRARARLEQVAPKAEEISEPSEQEARGVLDQYIAAFEAGDLQALERVLRDDATLEMTLSRTWFAGKRDCLRFIARFLGSAGLYRMLPTTANGQPAAAAYRLGAAGAYEAFALVVLTTTSTEITRITLFCDPGLFARFGAPATQLGHSSA
jgi:RNA polymerase sigma-70 factor (ECF subfamily)